MDTDIFSLHGRNIVVTGAAGGLGRAFALAFARRGAYVACADVDPAVEETCELISKAGGKALPLIADVSKDEPVFAMAAKVEAQLGVLHGLVNNAGIAIPPGRLLDVSVADWDRVIAANLRSVFLCSKAFLPMLLKSKDMGHMGTPEDLTGLAIYLASSASRYVTGQIFAHDGGLTAT